MSVVNILIILNISLIAICIMNWVMSRINEVFGYPIHWTLIPTRKNKMKLRRMHRARIKYVRMVNYDLHPMLVKGYRTAKAMYRCHILYRVANPCRNHLPIEPYRDSFKYMFNTEYKEQLKLKARLSVLGEL